jgi:plasmid replication initiation protein
MTKEVVINTPQTLGTNPDYVLQPHVISRSIYNLSVTARKLTAMAMSLLPFDLSTRTVRFSISDFIFSLGLEKGGNQYTLLENAVRECMGSVITIKTDTDWEMFTWFDFAAFKQKKGEITMTFSDHLADYLIELKRMYAKIELSALGRLSSRYALRLYEIAISYSSFAGQRENATDTWYFELEISQLRKVFAIKPEQYTRTANFRQRVIEDPIKEINNANIGIQINPEYIKQGKFLHSVRFVCKKVYRQPDLPGLYAESPETLQEKEFAKLQKLYPEDYKQFYEEEMAKPDKVPSMASHKAEVAAYRASLRLKEKHGIRR